MTQIILSAMLTQATSGTTTGDYKKGRGRFSPKYLKKCGMVPHSHRKVRAMNHFSLPQFPELQQTEDEYDPRDPVTGLRSTFDETLCELAERDEYIKKWRSARERLARAKQRAFDFEFDSSLHEPEVQGSDFYRKRQALKKRVARARKDLQEIETQSPEADLVEFLEQEREEELLEKEDEKIAKLKKRGLAATVSGDLIIWSSLKSRREWEAEHGSVVTP